MTNIELYYQYAYKTIERLTEIYKDGYNKETIEKLWSDYKLECFNNLETIQQEQDSLRLTILTALIGLNKEEIEKTDNHTNYEINICEIDLRDELLEHYKETLNQELEEDKVTSTVFDNWFSITKKNDKDYTNLDYIRMIRNALLHSEFSLVLDKDLYLGLINIKNYEHFSAKIYLYNFIQFIFAYYGTLPGLGLSTKNIFYDFPDVTKIKNSRNLEKFINKTRITEIKYQLKTNYDGNNTLEKQFYDKSNGNLKITIEDLDELLKENQDNFTITKIGNIKLEKDYIKILRNRIELNYGEKFYQISLDNQKEIILALLEQALDYKRLLSNWLFHFYHFSNSIFTNELNMSCLTGDEFHNDSCYNSLLILKAYLILYRMQNSEFEELDYDKVNFCFTKDDYKLESKHIDETEPFKDYFMEGLNKLKIKYPLLPEETLNKIQICTVIRDSLAHGNINIFQNNNHEHIIEFTDINPKEGSIRIIKMTIFKLAQFLSSEVFIAKEKKIKFI